MQAEKTMEKLSPRSYVTGGFDIIKPTLIAFIGKTLRKKNKAWWNENIYTKLKEEFEKNDKTLKKTGNVSDLFKLFDESMCFKTINENKKFFYKVLGEKGIKINTELLKIRNKWAHAPGKGMSENDADNAFQFMIEFMEIIDTTIVVRLYSIKDQMHRYYYQDRKVIASKENLINYLYEKIFLPILNDKRETDIVKKAKRKVIYTQDCFSKMKTREEVVNFFWDNIVNNPRGLDSYRVLKECGFTTFEDVREEFTVLSYGDKLDG